jgi:hypothetical protein
LKPKEAKRKQKKKKKPKGAKRTQKNPIEIN